jgi:hypothetical protein
MDLIFATIVLIEREFIDRDGSYLCHKCTEYERDVLMEME